MKLWVFNCALGLGVGAVGAGVTLEWGLGWGLTATGALLLALTLYVARAGGVH
jgi:hypothetical protein